MVYPCSISLGKNHFYGMVAKDIDRLVLIEPQMDFEGEEWAKVIHSESFLTLIDISKVEGNEITGKLTSLTSDKLSHEVTSIFPKI